MRDSEHYLQDACELYAVALLQKSAEEYQIAAHENSKIKEEAFWAYLSERSMGQADLETEPGLTYMTSLNKHLPHFVKEIAAKWPTAQLDFVDVEAEYRNLKLRGDFLIQGLPQGDVAVSLKNYRNGARRPQVCSGTFNSFILNFMFSSTAVGTFQAGKDGPPFRGSDLAARDRAVNLIGLGAVLPKLHRLDELNREIRAKFIDGPEYEFYEHNSFKKTCQEVGNEGAQIASEILNSVEPGAIKARLLTMTGLDGEDEILLIEPATYIDTITNKKFRGLRSLLNGANTNTQIVKRGQGLGIEFVHENVVVLKAQVPFTINKNGAWISGTPYAGVRLHHKEGVELAFGQRRPKKSRELATSVNTYLDLQPTGIFGE